MKETFSQIVRDFGNVDVVATAAGIVDNVEAENYAYPRWRKLLNVNLDGTWLFAREAGKHMLEKQTRGSIILIGSMSASICVRPQKQAAYNAVGDFSSTRTRSVDVNNMYASSSPKAQLQCWQNLSRQSKCRSQWIPNIIESENSFLIHQISVNAHMR